jgi:hypothetical protein
VLSAAVELRRHHSGRRSQGGGRDGRAIAAWQRRRVGRCARAGYGANCKVVRGGVLLEPLVAWGGVRRAKSDSLAVIRLRAANPSVSLALPISHPERRLASAHPDPRFLVRHLTIAPKMHRVQPLSPSSLPSHAPLPDGGIVYQIKRRSSPLPSRNAHVTDAFLSLSGRRACSACSVALARSDDVMLLLGLVTSNPRSRQPQQPPSWRLTLLVPPNNATRRSVSQLVWVVVALLSHLPTPCTTPSRVPEAFSTNHIAQHLPYP